MSAAKRKSFLPRRTATGATQFLAGAFFFSLTPDFSRVAAGGVEANGFNRFRRRIAAGIGQAVETALVCATLATRLKPGVNEKLQKSEMLPTPNDRVCRTLSRWRRLAVGG